MIAGVSPNRRNPFFLCFCFAASVAGTMAAAESAPQITVDANVQVSKSRATESHNEVLVAADPQDPARLLGCSMRLSPETNKVSTAVYLSTDRGRSWSPVLDTDKLKFSGDPTCGLGRDGAAYYVALGTTNEGKNIAPVYRSSNGGKTWSEPVSLHAFHGLDREYVTVDNTRGKFSGRVYVHATGWARAMEGDRKAADISVFASSDRGAHFSGPIKRVSAGRDYVLGVGNGVVMSDGTFVCIFGEVKNYWDAEGKAGDVPSTESDKPNGSLKVLTSTDGGESLEPATVVSDFHMLWPPSATSMIGGLAVDPGSAAFKDRLYAVWPDERSGRQEIYLAYSKDKGKTWSKPRRVNDERPSIKVESSRDDLMPTVAVNGKGVVGVAWYDRRDNADNLGWWVRFAASLDGGDTFLPSVRVSSTANQYEGRGQFPVFANVLGGGEAVEKSQRGGDLRLSVRLDGFMYNGGHTGGLAADVEGAFHPFWVDNRTGLPQVWTAAVHVAGPVLRNGEPDLAELDDVSDQVTFALSETHFDRVKGVVSLTARLKNTSDEPLRPPLKARVVSLSSELGDPEIVGSDNGKTGEGALWDFGKDLSGGTLLPGQETRPKVLTFHMEELRPFRQGKALKYGLVDLDARVLGHGSKRKTGDASTNPEARPTDAKENDGPRERD